MINLKKLILGACTLVLSTSLWAGMVTDTVDATTNAAGAAGHAAGNTAGAAGKAAANAGEVVKDAL